MMCFADEEADTEQLGTVIDKTWGGPLEPKPREDLGAAKLAPRTGQELPGCPAEPSDGEAVDLAARELRDRDSRTARDRGEITFRALFTSDTLCEGPCSIRIQELFNSQA